MCSKAYKLDLRMKKYQVVTGWMKWEQYNILRRHQLRVKNVKPSIDNRCPYRGAFVTLNTKKMRLQEDSVEKIEKKNRELVKKLRAINELKMPDFCYLKRRTHNRGEAYKLKPPSGFKEFRYDWEALKGSTQRRSLRRQESILRRLIHSQKLSPEDAKKMQMYLPRARDVPVEYLNYHPNNELIGSEAGNDSARYVEDGEPDNILTKLAAIQLHADQKTCPGGIYSPRYDLKTA